jgi:hypothetical protein
VITDPNSGPVTIQEVKGTFRGGALEYRDTGLETVQHHSLAD